MRYIEVILAVALLGAFLIGWAAADGNQSIAYTNQSSAYTLNPESREELMAFVNQARDLVLKEGQEKALEVFNDPKGEFVKGELYIIAYDFNGTRLAHPYEPEMLGENVLNATDINGVAIGKNLYDVAKRGGGFSYYIWSNPAHSGAEELKMTYVLKVNEGLWLGAGVYLPGQAPIFSKEVREDLVAFVDRARAFALNNTKDVIKKAFNDKNGEFVRGNSYIFAYDFKGNTMATFRPELVGTNRLEIRDPNGAYSFKDVIDAAKRGEGFVYVISQDPAENLTYKLKLDYVRKVDDEWFVGSGIYWPPV
jgi:polar amino acid transport system substrate-binding protein